MKNKFSEWLMIHGEDFLFTLGAIVMLFVILLTLGTFIMGAQWVFVEMVQFL